MVAALERSVPVFRRGLAHGDVGWGVVDDEGTVRLSADGVDLVSDARPPGRALERRLSGPFTERGEWLLKVLLSAELPQGLIGGVLPPVDVLASAQDRSPRTSYQLAPMAGVSIATADRLVRWLKLEGFLDVATGHLRIARPAELLERWRGLRRGPEQVIGAKWIIPTRDSLGALQSALANLAGPQGPPSASTSEGVAEGSRVVIRPRGCIAGFAACDLLGVGVVKGMPPRVYLEAPERALGELGLRRAPAGQPPDVIVARPAHPEAVFRAVVDRHGAPTCDIIQCWLDMAHERARGDEQSRALERGVLAPLFARARA